MVLILVDHSVKNTFRKLFNFLRISELKESILNVNISFIHK